MIISYIVSLPKAAPQTPLGGARRGGDPRTPLGKLSGSGVVCLQIHKLAYAYTRILVTSVNKYLRDTYMDMRMHARDHDSKFQNIV